MPLAIFWNLCKPRYRCKLLGIYLSSYFLMTCEIVLHVILDPYKKIKWFTPHPPLILSTSDQWHQPEQHASLENCPAACSPLHWWPVTQVLADWSVFYPFSLFSDISIKVAVEYLQNQNFNFKGTPLSFHLWPWWSIIFNTGASLRIFLHRKLSHGYDPSAPPIGHQSQKLVGLMNYQNEFFTTHQTHSL